MTTLDRQIRLIRRETDRLLRRITREVFGNRQARVTARRPVAEHPGRPRGAGRKRILNCGRCLRTKLAKNLPGQAETEVGG